MSSHSDNNTESDFRSWYALSQSSQSSKKSNQLRQVIEKKESLYGFTISAENIEQGEIYYLTENYNPTVLKLTSDSCNEFLSFIKIQYSADEIIEEEKSQSTGLGSIDHKKTNENKDPDNHPEKSNTNNFLHKILIKISSPVKVKHSVFYSFATFIILQITILPGNISNHKVGDWGIYFFISVFCAILYLSTWSYSKLFYNLRSYNDIFKLTASYCSVFLLLVFLEILVIDSIGEKYSIFWNIFLILAAQFFGIIISLFLTMIIYYLKGGKVIDLQQKK